MWNRNSKMLRFLLIELCEIRLSRSGKVKPYRDISYVLEEYRGYETPSTVLSGIFGFELVSTDTTSTLKYE